MPLQWLFTQKLTVLRFRCYSVITWLYDMVFLMCMRHCVVCVYCFKKSQCVCVCAAEHAEERLYWGSVRGQTTVGTTSHSACLHSELSSTFAWASHYVPRHCEALSYTAIRPSVCPSLGYSTPAACSLLATRDRWTADPFEDGRRSTASWTAIGRGHIVLLLLWR